MPSIVHNLNKFSQIDTIQTGGQDIDDGEMVEMRSKEDPDEVISRSTSRRPRIINDY